ncbi:MAG: hypothetical protein IPN88_11240 [Bacteroidetes bacterium]|nr:hypothetical protein [Bacteroidota bacterium]
MALYGFMVFRRINHPTNCNIEATRTTMYIVKCSGIHNTDKNMPEYMQKKNKEMFFSKQSTLFPIHQTYASANPYKQKRTNHCIESARKNKWTPSTTSHEDYVLPSCMKVKMDQWMKVHLSQGLI